MLRLTNFFLITTFKKWVSYLNGFVVKLALAKRASFFKDTLSCLQQFLTIENRFKKMKNAFYFT